MGSTINSIEVNAPLKVVYNQWTQFEEFPEFMEGVEEVRQEGDKRLFWKARIGGKEKCWEAEIVNQVPDQRIAWRSVTGARNSGEVVFEELDAMRTQVILTLDYESEGFLEAAGDVLGILSERVEGDLKRFRDYIESRGRETGGWRGEINEQTRPGATEGVTAGHLEQNPATSSTAGVVGAPADERQQTNKPAFTGGTEAGNVGASSTAADKIAGGSTTEAIPLSKEELKVGKRKVAAGEIKVRKVVETEQVSVPVELKREDAVVERIPASEVRGGTRSNFEEKEIRVPLTREEPVIEKETKVTGAVRVRKTEDAEEQRVSDTVRKEDVKVDRPGANRENLDESKAEARPKPNNPGR